MPTSTVTGMNDPLATFMEGKREDRRQVPLTATTVEVEIRGGIVVVSARRVFRNAEKQAIEAVLTFPVPVHATLFALEARIGERLLIAESRRRRVARETYEAAIADGLTAVLHEEVLRGVHMLSVGQLAPGTELEVTARWVASLAHVGGKGQIRIPMTVGEIYGTSPLSDSDDVLIGGAVGRADLVVRSAEGRVDVLGCDLVDGRGQVPLDAPIDLVVESPQGRPLRGVTAHGREFELRVTPEADCDRALSVALLVDRSGSMAEVASRAFGNASKHQLAVAALAAAALKLIAADDLDLWEFDTALERVGGVLAEAAEGDRRAVRDRFRALVARLGAPRGGTEIGLAIERVLRETSSRDLLLITDGKSHALDVQALAGMGRRISVLLVGEDSLEANVGHLAALTGGELFIAMEADMSGALAAALASLRMPSRPVEENGRGLRAVRRGARLEVRYGARREIVASEPLERALAALVAELRLSTLGEEEAAGLAEKEGLVTHLTSLVLVDHAGSVVDGIPTMRKVALPDPRSTRAENDWLGSDGRATLDRIRQIETNALRKLRHPSRSRKLRDFLDFDHSHPEPTGAEVMTASMDRDALKATFAEFDWNGASNRLVVGDLSIVPSDAAKALLRQACREDMIAVAARLGLDPLLLIIGWLAASSAVTSRAAARVERAIFRGVDQKEVRRAIEDIEDIEGYPVIG